MKLNEKQAAVLSALEHQADVPLNEIASQLGYRESTVRYYLEQFIERKIVRRKRVYINPYLIGYSNFIFYFSVAAASNSSSKKLLSKMRQFRQIVWLSELGGNYHYGASLSLKHVSEAPEFFENFSKLFSASVIEKTFSIRLKVITFGKTYLSKKKAPRIWLEQGGKPEFEIDSLDSKILSSLSSSYQSISSLAEQTEIPRSTFERRVRILRSKKIISGVQYIIDPGSFGFQTYRLLISSPLLAKVDREKLFTFAKNTPMVTKYIECFGDWDAEIEVDCQHPAKTSELRSQLFHQFPFIKNIQIVPLLHNIDCPMYNALEI